MRSRGYGRIEFCICILTSAFVGASRQSPPSPRSMRRLSSTEYSIGNWRTRSLTKHSRETHGLGLREAARLHVEDHLVADLRDAGLVLRGVLLATDADGRVGVGRELVLISRASHSVLFLQPFRCFGMWTTPRYVLRPWPTEMDLAMMLDVVSSARGSSWRRYPWCWPSLASAMESTSPRALRP